MASRVAGAVLALTAAGLLAASVVVVPWWAGHPTFKGAELKTKEITVGPLGATGCNTGGDGACMSVPVDATFETAGYALVGVASLLVLVLVAIGVFAFTAAPRRKTFAVFAIVGAVIAAGLGVVLFLVEPQVRTETPLPMGIGLYTFFGGVAMTLVTSVVALRMQDAARPRVQLAPPRQQRPSAKDMQPAPQPGVDVQALLADDALRPSRPAMQPPAAVQSPGGALPGPSGPLGQPLFNSAPQLKPLYEVQGFVPKPSVNLPTRAPTPIPRDQISAHAGIPTPASIQAQPDLAGGDGETDRDLLGINKPKPFAAFAAPAPRAKAPSIAPTPSPASAPAPAAARPTPPPPKSATIPPPMKPQVKSPTIPPPRSATLPPPMKSPSPPKPLALPRQPSPPPSSATVPPQPLAPNATLATSAAVPPPPNATLRAETNTEDFDALKTAAAEPKKPVLATAPADRPSFDAMKTYEVPPKPAVPFPPRTELRAHSDRKQRLLTEDIGSSTSIDTDVQAQAIDENAVAPDTFESMTAEQQRPPTATAETSLDDAPRPAASTDVNPVAPAVAERLKPAEKPKLPISTAPDSLPPPSAQQQTTSGPSPACPQCEAPMAWVEAHLRFYCKSCKMYF